jgi:hypothetical protein
VIDTRDDRLRPWVARASVLIWDRMADARAHAQVGRITEAGQRLDELRLGLLDDQSRTGSLLSNARAAFYRAAFREEPHDPDIHQVVRPDPSGELAARFSPIAGRNQYQDLRAAITAAADGLHRLAAAAGPERRQELLEDWERRERDRLIGQTRRTLSDAQVALSEAVSRIRIKPELR